MAKPAVLTMISGASTPTVSNTFVNNNSEICTLQISGTFASATVKVEGIVDINSGRWVSLATFDLTDLDLKTNGMSDKSLYRVGIAGILRVRISLTEINGGDITVMANFVDTEFYGKELPPSSEAPFTAYDLAVLGGYTGTQADYEAALADIVEAVPLSRQMAGIAQEAAERAASSATYVENYAVSASNSASNAGISATNASESATDAASSASDASDYATAAANSATGASDSAARAEDFAVNASTSSSNAAVSASNAASSASGAAGSAVNASSSAANASNSASNASNSAASAANSAFNAAGSATSAATSATAAQNAVGAIAPAIVTEWLNENVNPVGSAVVVDSSLSISGAAADAKVTGDQISGVTTSLSDYTIISEQSVNSKMAMSGSANNGNITWTRTDSAKNEITINGTSTSASVININALGATNTRPLIFGAANETVYSKIVFNTTDSTSNIKLSILVYKSGGEYTSYLLDFNNNTALVRTDKTTTAVLCRYQLIAGGSVSSDVVSFNINIIVPHYMESTNDNTNVNRAIIRRLRFCNKCILGPGIFYSNASIELTGGMTLMGSGTRTTQLIYTGAENAITGNYDTQVSDIWIRGATEDIEISSTEGEKNGIYISGESSTAIGGMVIENCTFTNFTGSGIKATSTGYPTRGFIINNCMFRNCYCGINLNKKTEYWKISNVISRLNYYGIIDNGGNNLITNSGFDSNEIGLLIDDEDGTHGNNTHGSFSNCTMNHSGTAAIKTLGTGSHLLETGMVFSNCQFFYGGLNLDHVYGFGFNNCNFGSETPITINASQSVIFSNCLFRLASDSPITITNSANKIIRFFNCYTRYGTAIAEDPQA